MSGGAEPSEEVRGLPGLIVISAETLLGDEEAVQGKA